MTSRHIRVIGLLAALAVLGCNGNSPTTAKGKTAVQDAAMAKEPDLKAVYTVGRTWTYKVTNVGQEPASDTKVIKVKSVSGSTATLETTDSTGTHTSTLDLSKSAPMAGFWNVSGGGGTGTTSGAKTYSIADEASSGATDAATPTPTPTPTATPTATPTPTPTPTATPTATPTPTPTPTARPTATPTPRPSAKATPTPDPADDPFGALGTALGGLASDPDALVPKLKSSTPERITVAAGPYDTLHETYSWKLTFFVTLDATIEAYVNAKVGLVKMTMKSHATAPASLPPGSTMSGTGDTQSTMELKSVTD